MTNKDITFLRQVQTKFNKQIKFWHINVQKSVNVPKNSLESGLSHFSDCLSSLKPTVRPS